MGHRSRKWPVTQAVIMSSSLEKSYSFFGYSVRLKMSYRFCVDGVMYDGQRAYFGDWTRWGSSFLIPSELPRTPLGHAVSVAYDPEQPQRSVLVPGVSKSSLLMATVSLFLLAFGVVLVVQLLRPSLH